MCTVIMQQHSNMMFCRGRSDSIPAKKLSTNSGAAPAHREGMNVHVLRTDVEDFTDHRAYHG